MGWLIFFSFWILFLWLYRRSERNKQLRVQAMAKDTQSDYGLLKIEFDESMEYFNAAADSKTRLGHIDRAIGSLERMEEILPGKEHSPQKLPQLKSLKEALTYSDINEQYEKTMKKARDSTIIVAKVNYATAAQTILSEGLKLGLDKKTLAKEIAEANDFINRIQYDEYLAKAGKEEKKGNVKKAIDQYQVALYFLKMTSMGGEGTGSLTEDVEGRIQKLYENGATNDKNGR